MGAIRRLSSSKLTRHFPLHSSFYSHSSFDKSEWHRPTNSLFGSNSSRLVMSIPCFFIIGTTFAAILCRISLATSSSGPFKGVMNLQYLRGKTMKRPPYSIIWMSAMVVVSMYADRHRLLTTRTCSRAWSGP